MKITKFEYYNIGTLIENIRKVEIKGQPEKKIYKDSDIKLLENINPIDISICQYYVLEKDLNEIDTCRNALLEYGVDIFNLKGFVRVYSKDEKGSNQIFDVLPPIVEISPQDKGIKLLCDGMHRLYLAREKEESINVILIDDIKKGFPYYAMPNEKGWESVEKCIEVPDIKKNYRIKKYKTLFRDFNTAFLNVSQPRTNNKPKKLKVGGAKVDMKIPCSVA